MFRIKEQYLIFACAIATDADAGAIQATHNQRGLYGRRYSAIRSIEFRWRFQYRMIEFPMKSLNIRVEDVC